MKNLEQVIKPIQYLFLLVISFLIIFTLSQTIYLTKINAENKTNNDSLIQPLQDSQTIYIKNTGNSPGDDSNNGDENTPVKTFGGALEKMTSNKATFILLSDYITNGWFDVTGNRDITIKSKVEEETNYTIKRVSEKIFFHLFYVDSGSSLTFDSIKIDGTVTGANDSEITSQGSNNNLISLNGGTLNLNNNTILEKNTAKNGGGAIDAYGNNSKISLSNSTIQDCKALNGSGGAINAGGSNIEITVESSTFKNNSGTNGGAIYLADRGELTINSTNNEFSSNKADQNKEVNLGDGGAIYLFNSSLTFSEDSKTVFKDQNTATVFGGAIFANGTSPGYTINFNGNTTITNNTAQKGAAIGLWGVGSLNTAENPPDGSDYCLTISDNTATWNGGGICAFAGDYVFNQNIEIGSTITLYSANIQRNKNTSENVDKDLISDTQFSGGGFYIGERCVLNLENVIISSNTITHGFITENSGLHDNIYAGGIGLCPNAEAHFYLTDGGAIYDNTGENNASDIVLIPKTPAIEYDSGAQLFLSKYALGNGAYNWINNDNIPTQTGSIPITASSSDMDFISKLSSENQNKAEELAKVFIQENTTTAFFGAGGIMCNGILNIGRSGFGGLSVSKTIVGNSGDLNRTFHFTVTLDDKTVNGTYGEMGFVDGVAHVTLKSGETVTASGLKEETKYSVTEDEANQNGYTTGSTGTSGNIPDSDIAQAEFINTYNEPDSGTLSVSKVIQGTLLEGTNPSFSFNLRLIGNDLPTSISYYTSSGNTGDLNLVGGSASFNLSSNETIYFYNLPIGTVYYLSENTPDNYTVEWENPTGTIQAGTTTRAIATNTYNENHSKAEISPGDGNTVLIGQDITYQIYWENTSNQAQHIQIVDPLDIGVDFKSASVGSTVLNSEASQPAEGTLNGQDISISYTDSTDLPNGVTAPDYLFDKFVTWDLGNQPANSSGYVTLVVTVNDNAVIADIVKNRASVYYDNSWHLTEEPSNPIDDNGFILRKDLFVSGSQTTTGNYTFDITIRNSSGTIATNITGKYGDVTFSQGTAQVSLRDNQSVQVSGIPVGYRFFITETNPEDYNVQWSSSNNNVDIDGSSLSGIIGSTGQLFTFTCNNIGNGNHKVEMNPGDGQSVIVGQDITYNIYWENTSSQAQHVQIVDPLDKGVNFESASYGNVILNSPVNTTTGTVDGIDVSISYSDSNTLPSGVSQPDYSYEGFITWDLGTQQPGASGYVELIVTVNSDALIEDIVKDIASVGFNNQWYPTEEPENPLYEPEKEEIDPGDNQTVTVGEQITYTIDWANPSSEPASVTIVDPLDVGLTYLSSSNNGSYNASATLPTGAVPVDYDYHGVVTWNLGEQPPNSHGSVTLTVVVNENAGLKVDNQAFVQLNNYWYPTSEPENPLGGPNKTETDPGDGKLVEVGQLITYSISYVNNQNTAQTITIVDPVDIGLDFVSASNGGIYNQSGMLPTDLSVDYNYRGTITWSIENVPPQGTGSVTFTGRVNSNALIDHLIDNQAFVRVGNLEWIPTEEPENPLEEFSKVETTPGDGQMVDIGEEITYQISYINNGSTTQTITIVDPIDIGLDFVSASNNGVFNRQGTLPAGSSVDYNWSGTVTWKIENVAPGQSGYVTLTCRVNNQALLAMIVKDQAFVQFGNGPFNPTEEPENPLEEESSSKTELSPGNGQTVKVGDLITYEITYVNNNSTSQTISIIDPLDSGLDFVSASNNGVYLTNEVLPPFVGQVNYTYYGIVTWTIENVAPGASDNVTLTCRVNSSALTDYLIDNQAFVKIGNNSWMPTEEPQNPLLPTNLTIEKFQSVNDGNKTKNYQQIKSGDKVTYYLIITNTSNKAIEDITVTDPIPEGFTLIEGSISNSGTQNNDQIIWKIPVLEAGRSITVEASFSIPGNLGDQVIYYKNTAYVHSSENPNDIPSNEVVVGTPKNTTVTTITTTTTKIKRSSSSRAPVTGINNSSILLFVLIIIIALVVLILFERRIRKRQNS